ncbi:MAG: NAD-dependent epimerase/dehydratase family protein [Chloroflexi bacterium]|nr:NAD-dependent epimerase/dehydratase family protein [Chloroflexota bacterium]
MKVLVTGGAGFIGSHTVDLLLEKGYEVRILDSLQPRVHPRGLPPWVPEEAEFVRGDVADRADMARAMEGVEAVFHLAAYQDYLPDFSRFIHTNAESAALIFELIVSDPRRYPVRKIVFASSQAVCGEGRYLCPSCAGGATAPTIEEQLGHGAPCPYPGAGRPRYDQEHERYRGRPAANGSGPAFPPSAVRIPGPRSLEQLRRGDWEIHCPGCGGYMQPLLIDVDTISPGTTYGVSKYAIELLADRLGRRYGIPTACMRYTYVQGPRNSFYNAYSGIARRFALRLLHGLPPIAYEDGRQLRDYVNVRDVARANVLVMEDPRADFGVFNVGGGRAVTVLKFARLMLDEFDSDLEVMVPGEFRLGDTRHTISDISGLLALGWAPTIPVEQNVAQYVAWIREQQGTEEYLAEAERVMREQNVIQRARVSA